MCKHLHVHIYTYIGHPSSASPDGGLAVPAVWHRGQVGSLSRAQRLCFSLNMDLHNSLGIKPHHHNICLCVCLLLALRRCVVVGVCWLQTPFCFVFQMWGVQEPLEGKRLNVGSGGEAGHRANFCALFPKEKKLTGKCSSCGSSSCTPRCLQPVAELLQGGLIPADATEALREGWMRSPLCHLCASLRTEQHTRALLAIPRTYPMLHPRGI